jgi:hypothetical protein
MVRGAVAALLVACVSAPQRPVGNRAISAPRRTDTEAELPVPAAAESMATIPNCLLRGFTLDDTTAFVSCAQGLIVAIDLVTRAVTPLVQLSPPVVPSHLPLAVDSADLYFVSGYSRLSSIPKTGGDPVLLAKDLFALSLRVHNGELFIAARHNGIHRFVKGTVQRIAAADRPRGLAFDGNDIYFADHANGTEDAHLFVTSIGQSAPTDLGPITYGEFTVANHWLFADQMIELGTKTTKKLPNGCLAYVSDGPFVFANCGQLVGQRVPSGDWITLGHFAIWPSQLAANDSFVCAALDVGPRQDARVDCLPRPPSLRP